MTTKHKSFLQAIAQRRMAGPRAKQAGSFGYGIGTADVYQRQVLDSVDELPHSLVIDDESLKRAANTVTFCDAQNRIEAFIGKAAKLIEQTEPADILPKGVQAPPNTLMVLQHVITTPREDRDQDILLTEGAKLDPKAPLLWQHISTFPMGGVITTLQHDKKVLRVATALLDVNDLTSDAAKLIIGNALRISHGFRVLDYEERLDDDGEPMFGFLIKAFEIMEVSLVSVPSNVEAEIELYAAGKLASPTFKSHAKRLFDNRTKQAPGVTFQKPTVKQIDLVKGFDVGQEHLEPSRLEYDWVSRFLGCQVKEIFVTGTHVPQARMGSVLTGARTVMAEQQFESQDIRNITSDGQEQPPTHEVIQLNSRQSDTFLVDGLQFFKGADGKNVVLKFAGGWSGLSLVVYSAEATCGGDTIRDIWNWAVENNFLKGEAFALTGTFLPRKGDRWGDLFLPEKNRGPLVRAVQQINERGDEMPSRGMIFMGPPGTGKTLSGRVMMNDAKATFIWVSARDFYRCGAVNGICRALDLARETAPSIVFIEDVDNWLSDYAIDTLKTELDGINKTAGVLTILTTNYPKRLPKAIIDRPGRFHDVLNFDLPDAEARKAMIEKWLPTAEHDDLKLAVKQTKGYSGAHIYELTAFARTLADEGDDNKTMGDHLRDAMKRLEEQRELIDQVQLSDSNFRPRGLRLGTPTQKQTRPAAPKQKASQGDEAPSQGGREAASEGQPPAAVLEKRGRALSRRNRERLQETVDDLAELETTELNRSQMALVRGCEGRLKECLTEAGGDDENASDPQPKSGPANPASPAPTPSPDHATKAPPNNQQRHAKTDHTPGTDPANADGSEPTPEELTIEAAMRHVLTAATNEQLLVCANALGAVLRTHDADARAAGYRRAIGEF